jgi:hypothetical protein
MTVKAHLLAMSGCLDSGAAKRRQGETTTVMITATSGDLSNITSVSLTVQ